MRSIVVVMVAVWLSACASAISTGAGQGGRDTSGRTYTEASADNKLRAQVITALVRDSQIPAMDIDVRCLNGVVTLKGKVKHSAIAKRAELLAAEVSGVTRVVNLLYITK